MRLRTWHAEAAIAAGILSIVPIAHRSGWEAIGALAVLMSFMRGQIADRHSAESAAIAAAGQAPQVDCWRWNGRYYVTGEILWCASFVHSRMWSALIGCALFLLYPVWRRYYRSRARS